MDFINSNKEYDLVTMQILGVFGFWCQKRRERQSIWILLWIVGMMISCLIVI